MGFRVLGPGKRGCSFWRPRRFKVATQRKMTFGVWSWAVNPQPQTPNVIVLYVVTLNWTVSVSRSHTPLLGPETLNPKHHSVRVFDAIPRNTSRFQMSKIRWWIWGFSKHRSEARISSLNARWGSAFLPTGELKIRNVRESFALLAKWRKIDIKQIQEIFTLLKNHNTGNCDVINDFLASRVPNLAWEMTAPEAEFLNQKLLNRNPHLYATLTN